MLGLIAVEAFIAVNALAAYLLACRRRGQWLTPIAWLTDREVPRG